MKKSGTLGFLVLAFGIFALTADAQEPAKSEASVTLAEAAQAGQTTIIVTNPGQLWPKRPLLVRGEDNQAEIHYIYAFDQDRVTLSSGLRGSYPRGSVLIQDPSELRSALSAGTPVAGEPGGVSAGVRPLVSPFQSR